MRVSTSGVLQNAVMTGIRSESVCVVDHADGGTVFIGGYWGATAVTSTFDTPWDGGASAGKRVFASSAPRSDIWTVFPAGGAVFAGGYTRDSRFLGALWRYDAGAWDDVTPTGGFLLDGGLALVTAGWGTSADDFFVTGEQDDFVQVVNQVVHVKDGVPTAFVLPDTPLGVWGTGSNDVWIGGQGFIARLRDGALTVLDAGVGVVWNSVWAADSSSVVLGGAGPSESCPGLVARWSPDAVDSQCLDPYAAITSVHGVSSTDIWAVSADGGIWHYGP